jgi:hypothetical protein
MGRMADMANETVKVAVVENEVEAQLLDSILAERSIPHALRSYRDSAFDGIYQFQKGWGVVYAPLEFKAEVLEIISDIRSGALAEGYTAPCCGKAHADVPYSQCSTRHGSAEAGDGVDECEHAKHGKD